MAKVDITFKLIAKGGAPLAGEAQYRPSTAGTDGRPVHTVATDPKNGEAKFQVEAGERVLIFLPRQAKSNPLGVYDHFRQEENLIFTAPAAGGAKDLGTFEYEPPASASAQITGRLLKRVGKQELPVPDAAVAILDGTG